IGEPFATPFDEQLGDFPSAADVVAADRAHPVIPQATIEENDRDSCPGATFRRFARDDGEGGDHTVDAVGQDQRNHFVDILAVVDRKQQDRAARLLYTSRQTVNNV